MGHSADSPRNIVSRRQTLNAIGRVGGLLAASQLTTAFQPGLHAAGFIAGRNDRIKVGQIGVGHAHATKLSVYRASPDYEVVGIVEPDEILRVSAQSQAVYQDLPWLTAEQLLNRSDLQVVLVETRVRDLLSTAASCIAAGKHVHLDKPAGESFPVYQQLLADAAEKQLMVQMGYMYRYSPAVILLREFLRNGWLGDVFELQTVMSKVVPDAARRQLTEYPGGMMFELGCHIIDLAVGVLGRPQSVTAFHQHASSADDSLLDNMLAVLQYDRALATIKSSAQEVEGFSRRQLTVCGTEGTFHIQPLDQPAVRLSLSRDRGDYKKGTQDLTLPRYSRYEGDAADMARILRGEKSVDFDYTHDLAVQETVLKASGLLG
ncbi:MAG: Gfo/Idh/MocA family oxidoreductase [Planctomycetaceae bacterium]|nr:Gfo/Idh/MocA family oxidoreductase [Planctomycetaceae bacterium]